ncbi:MAG: JAB domain-containing protein, partial [Lachnospiraceae bacterium]|nr:JAB domain-containing protein [Lachnospiraceae bacterium]
TSAEEIFHRYSGEMRRERQEVVKVLFLNGQCRLIREYEASRGSVNASLVPVREILVEAVKSEAVYFILMHNHPSGDPMPSHEDRTVTERLKEAGKLVGIELLDHLIFGSARYVSMRQRGWIT